MRKLQGQTRRGFLHVLPVHDVRSQALSLSWLIKFWLEAHDSPYWKLHYTDDAGVRWSFRMKNR